MDKEDITTECRRLLCDIITYKKISAQEAKSLILEIKFQFKAIVREHLEGVVILLRENEVQRSIKKKVIFPYF